MQNNTHTQHVIANPKKTPSSNGRSHKSTKHQCTRCFWCFCLPDRWEITFVVAWSIDPTLLAVKSFDQMDRLQVLIPWRFDSQPGILGRLGLNQVVVLHGFFVGGWIVDEWIWGVNFRDGCWNVPSPCPRSQWPLGEKHVLGYGDLCRPLFATCTVGERPKRYIYIYMCINVFVFLRFGIIWFFWILCGSVVLAIPHGPTSGRAASSLVCSIFTL